MRIAAPATAVAPVLWLLYLAFAARVAGQALVVFRHVQWLPSNEAWMSGALAYPVLLAAQLLILAIFARVLYDFTSGRGWFVEPHPAFARGLYVFGLVYFTTMLARGIVSLHPAAAWLGDPIPIVFHLVLASFLLVVAAWHRGQRISSDGFAE